MRQIAIFIAVGSAAALTHLTVVAGVVELLGLKPLAANVIGFCVAFLVSFAGHARWTFPLSQSVTLRRGRAFFAVACTGFVLNQAAYAEVLHLFGPRAISPASPRADRGRRGDIFAIEAVGFRAAAS